MVQPENQRNRLISGWAAMVGGLLVLFLLPMMANGESISESKRPQKKPASISPLSMKGYPVIHARKMLVSYRVEPTKYGSVIRVELWYGRGPKGRWQLYDYDEDLKSPIEFMAPGEGVWRFLVVAVDQWGRRSWSPDGKSSQSVRRTIPSDAVPPQQVVFVDYTKPQLYLYSPRGAIEDYRKESIKIRWQGFDGQLASGPVQLSYKRGESDRWTVIGQGLPAVGEFDWRIPDRLGGPIVIRATLTDEGGHQAQEMSGILKINNQESYAMIKPLEIDGSIEDSISIYPQIPETQIDRSDQTAQAARLFRIGFLHSQRFEWAKAIEAYQKALRISPKQVEVRVNLANAYFRSGNFEKALGHFEGVLQAQPHRGNALFNLAQTQIALKHYDKSIETLNKLLRQDRLDWQAWRMRGESAEKIGDVTLAMHSWRQAANSNLPEIRRAAQERLTLLADEDP